MAAQASFGTRLAQLAYLDSMNGVPAPARVAIGVAVALTTWDLRRRSRLTLAALEPHELRDIGVTPGDARAEAAKPFWRD